MYSFIHSSLRALIPSFFSWGFQGNLIPVFLLLAGIGGYVGYGSNNNLSSDNSAGIVEEAAFACGNPTNLRLEIEEIFVVRGSWSAVSGATSYNVRFRPVGSTTWENRITAATTQLMIVLQNQDYEWEVQAVCGDEVSEWVSGLEFNSNCDAPDALTVGTVTASQAELSWDPVSTVQNYLLRYRAVGATNWTQISTANISFVTLAGLVSGVNYEWQVKTDCNSSESDWVSGANFQTEGTSCNSPSGLSLTNITGTSAQLDWNVVAGALEYDLRYRVLGTTAWTTIQVSGNSVTLQNLEIGTDYEWEIRSNCGDTNSSWVSGPDITTSCPEPDGLVVNNISLTSATVVWNAVSGAESYEMRYRITGGSTWTVEALDQTNFNITGLNESTNYEWQVRTLCEDGTSSWARGQFFETDGAPCAAPSDLVVDNVVFNGADFSWTAAPGIQDYELRYRVTGGSTWTVQQVSGTTLTVADLDTFTNYEWQVRSICPNSESEWIKGPFFQTPGPPCEQPTEPIVSTITESSSLVSWTPVPGFSEYRVRYRITGGTVWTDQAVTGTSLLISNLTFSTNYEWQVRTICAQSESDWLQGPFFETIGPPCEVPSNLAVSNITTNSAQFDWSPASGEQNYEVRYRVTASAAWTTQDVTDTTFSVNDLAVDTNYEWQVRTKCQLSESDWIQGPFFKTLTPCDPPSGLSVDSVGATSSTVSWTPVAGEQTYRLRYRLVGSTTWTLEEVTGTTGTLINLVPESNYEWQVQTLCSVSNSVWITGPVFSTIATPCDAPENLTVTQLTDNSAQLNWDVAEGALTYRVRYREKGTTIWTTQVVDQSTLVLEGLQENTEYEWQVRTNCEGENSQNVNGPDFQTLETPCPAPANLVVSELNSISAMVSWDAVSEALRYRVRFRIVGGEAWTLDSLTANTYIFDSLVAESNYEWQIQAVCEVANSLWVDGPDFQTPVTCPPPLELIVDNITSLTAEIIWTAPFDTLGITYSYNLRYREAGTSEWEVESKEVSSSILSKLEPETEYEWQVQTDCGGSNTSEWVEGPNFTTEPAPCVDPAGLSVFGVGQDSASFSWNAIPGALEYQIRYKEAETDLWIILVVQDTTILLQELLAGTDYVWEVRSDCGNSLSQWVPGEPFTTDSIPCDPPQALSVDSLTNTTVHVSWEGYENATLYRVRYRVSGTELWSTLETSEVFAIITDLEANTTYQWLVQSECGSIPTEWVVGEDFTTLENPASCFPPSDLVVLGTTEFTASVSWSSSIDASGYRLRYRQQGTVPWAVISLEDTAVVIGNLTDGITYEWEVQSACDTLFSSWATGDPFTTVDIPEDCQDPEDLQVLETGPQVASLAWKGALFADLYEIRYKLVSDSTWQDATSSFSNVVLQDLSEFSVYQWEVRSLCTNDTSQWIAGPNFTTEIGPMVSLLQPADSSFLSAGDSVQIEAEATDLDGEIASISLYANDTLLSTVDSSYFLFTWREIPKGVFRIFAIATDNDGNTDTSDVARLFVGFDSTNLLVSDFIVFGNELCFLDSAQVIFGDASIGAVSYSWNFGEDAFPATADSAGPHVVKYATSGLKTVELVVQDSLGNTDIRTQTIGVFTKPQAGFAGDDFLVCGDQDTVVLSGSPANADSVRWGVVGGEARLLQPDSPITLVENLNQGENVFVWEIFNGTCVSDPDTLVVIKGSCIPILSGDISGEDTLCLTDVGTTFSVPEDSLADEFIWTLPPGIEGDVNGNVLTITGISGEGGLITVMAKNEFGESQTKGKEVAIEDCSDEFQLITFTAYEGELEDILIDWVAEFEQEVLGYTIERSLDSLEFEEVRTITPRNGQETRNRYIEPDDFVVGGSYFYRIRIETVEGVIIYSKIVELVLNGQEPLLSFSLNPNPVVENKLNIQVEVIRAGYLAIEGFDRLGRKVLDADEPVSSGFNAITVDCPFLTDGVYLLRLKKRENGKEEIIKFMKR